MTKEETESLLREAKIARFCTLNKDGTIHGRTGPYTPRTRRATGSSSLTTRGAVGLAVQETESELRATRARRQSAVLV
jgi:hypothetical protein